MVEIKNGNITHTRGDTANFKLNLTVDGAEPDSYSALFSVKRTLNDTKYLFQKESLDGIITITHEDTQGLPYGNYFYDIEICIDPSTEGERYITVGPHRYTLLADVTTYKEQPTEPEDAEETVVEEP